MAGVAHTARMKVTYGTSKLGEKLGLDWLTYNPLIFWFFHEVAAASAPVVADTFEDVFPHARRYIDIGAGSGAYAAALQARGKIVSVYEHSRLGRLLARQQGLDARPFDLASNTPDRRHVGPSDVGYCFEVAEHLPPNLGDRLVQFTAAVAETVVFTAAQPGQRGTGHVNEQPPDYWIRRFEQQGMSHRADLQERVAAGFAGAPVEWLARNVLVFDSAHLGR
jgi:hypothetical protein